MAETLLRLDVWRPARPDKRLLYAKPENDLPSVIELHENRLYEQVYSWKVCGDMWTSISSDEEAKKIKEMLTTNFASSEPPEERSFVKMKVVVQKLKDYLFSNENNRKWQIWEQPISQDDTDDLFHIQPLLLLYHHLKWLCEVFEDIQGASVTIR